MLRFLFRALIVLILVTAALLAYALLVPAGPGNEKLVRLMPGSSTRHIAPDLENAGIIRSRYAFLFWHYLRGRAPLKAGNTPLTTRLACEKCMNASRAVTSTSIF